MEPITYDDVECEFSSWYLETAKPITNTLEEILKDLGLFSEIEFVEIDSPKFYNFRTDRIFVEADYNSTSGAKIRRYINANKEAFEEWLVAHHKSRDGFASFYPHTFDSWLDDTNYFTEPDHIHLTSILNFILTEIEELNEVEDIYNSMDEPAQIDITNYDELTSK